nr:hypothetical protein [Paenibacillus xylanexedens]
MVNWNQLKQWAEEEKLHNVLQKMLEINECNYFFAYTNQDGRELIDEQSEGGVAVWTYQQPNNKYQVKVMKSSVSYYDEEDRFYDCDVNGVELIGTIS